MQLYVCLAGSHLLHFRPQLVLWIALFVFSQFQSPLYVTKKMKAKLEFFNAIFESLLHLYFAR